MSNKVMRFILLISIVLSFSNMAFAASASFKMRGSPTYMGTVLNAGQNKVDALYRAYFEIYGIPSNSVVKNVTVSVGSPSGINGSMTVHELVLSGGATVARQPWNGMLNNSITFSQFNGQTVASRYDVWFNASFLIGYYVGGSLYMPHASRSYKDATLTISY